ncbi:MAG: M48 family metallopeptidase [Alphaproteobacteria bacterium]
MAAGLQTHIWDNNIRSIILLAAYPFIIMAMVWAVSYVLGMSQGGYSAAGANYDFGVVYANRLLIEFWPIILTVIAVWFMISYFWNTSMIRALSHAHEVTRKDEPELYNLLENLCIAQGMPMPQLNVIETHARNAFASGIDTRSYAVTVTRGLLNSLSKDEVEGVLAHELTHIINRDVRLLMVTVIFTGMIGFAAQMAWSSIRHGFIYRSSSRHDRRGGGILILLAIAAILWIGYMATLFMRFALSRRREFMADAGAVQMTKNPEAMMRALMRIAGADYMPHTPADIDMMCIENARPFMGLFATHPPIKNRILALSQTTNTPVPHLPHTGPAPAGQGFGDRTRRNPWLTAQRHGVGQISRND